MASLNIGPSLTDMWPKKQAQRDALWLLLWCVGVFIVAEHFNVFEALHEFTRQHEEDDLDEIVTVVISLPLAFVAYILRRNREMRIEVEKRRRAEDSLRKLAHFDALTGLANRSLLEERLRSAAERVKGDGSTIAVFFIDLDGFKEINDTHGHAGGDRLLREVGQRILRRVRGHDTVARLGGDEFVILLEEVNSISEIELIAQRLVAEIGLPCAYADAMFSVSASIGIAVHSGRDRLDGQHLIRYADRAMYDAKESGKNQYCFFQAN